MTEDVSLPRRAVWFLASLVLLTVLTTIAFFALDYCGAELCRFWKALC